MIQVVCIAWRSLFIPGNGCIRKVVPFIIRIRCRLNIYFTSLSLRKLNASDKWRNHQLKRNSIWLASIADGSSHRRTLSALRRARVQTHTARFGNLYSKSETGMKRQHIKILHQLRIIIGTVAHIGSRPVLFRNLVIRLVARDQRKEKGRCRLSGTTLDKAFSRDYWKGPPVYRLSVTWRFPWLPPGG